MGYYLTMNIEHVWAAGFWDGEGCVSIAVRNNTANPRIVAEISQVNREVLDRFASAVGFGSVIGPYSQKNPNARDFYCWRVEGASNVELLRSRIYDYIGTIKKSQMDDALSVRTAWESDPRCRSGHSLTKNRRGYHCQECVTANGKANQKPILGHKICSFCKEDKDFSEFNIMRSRADGRQTVCRDCMKSYRRKG